jgi:uncharacterized protein
MTKRITVEGSHGKAVRLSKGERLAVVNTLGGQVVDFWSLVEPGAEVLSMHHTRAALKHLVPTAGDPLWSNLRRPILLVTEDTSPGVHDTLIAACDTARYREYGVTGPHRTCCDNYREAIAELGLSRDEVPAPFNLFMNIPWDADGRLEWGTSPARAGDAFTVEALVDQVIVVSSCPMDLNPISGGEPRAVDLVVGA